LTGALAVLSARREAAKIIPGGQSLAPMLNMRLAHPAHLIDINGLTELEGVHVEADHLVIGALTRHADLARHALVTKYAPMLCTRSCNNRPLCNPPTRHPLGGSLAHADPAVQLPLAALALDASMEIAFANGRRLVPASEFFVSVFTTALQAGELLAAIHIPLPERPEGWGFACLRGAPATSPWCWSHAVSLRRTGAPNARGWCSAASPQTRTRGRQGCTRMWRCRLDLASCRCDRRGADIEESKWITSAFRRELLAACTRRARRCDGALALSEVQTVPVTLRVNGDEKLVLVEPRKLLSDTLREDCRLTDTHVGCEHGVCGACTVLVDGWSVDSCLIYAVQMAGHTIITIEGVARDGHLSPVQQALHEAHGLQCGFCTPGIVLTRGQRAPCSSCSWR
jgi:xanthine dehydrogenase iron-sulfur cluster and FAD-binding subunit A